MAAPDLPPNPSPERAADDSSPASRVARREADVGETRAANRAWWDAEAADYLAEHGDFLGDAQLIWGPEGWSEEELRLLGPNGSLRGRRVLEFGGGAAQGGRWCAAQGAQVVSSDLSLGMLGSARVINGRHDGPAPALLAADALQLPVAEESVDIAFSAYGAVPFVADSAALMRELHRVLRPGGRLAFSTSHPIRWAFPDVPGEAGLTATTSYFATEPYVEEGADGLATYVEHHRTLADRVGELLAAGLQLSALVEPPWRPGHAGVWGGWSPLRGERIPGTLVLVATRPG